MQKNKGFMIAALLAAMWYSPAALADDDQPVVSPSKFTIGDYSAKKKKLAELKLEVEIKKQENELRNPGGQVNQVAMQALPVVPSAPAPSKVNFSNPDEFELTAIFGRTSALKAEVKVDGRPYVVETGSKSIPGWTVTSVSTDRVVLSSGKKSKTIYMAAAASAAPAGFDAGIKSLPPVPPMGVQGIGR